MPPNVMVLLMVIMMIMVAIANCQTTTVRGFLSDSDLNALITKESPLLAQHIESLQIADMSFVRKFFHNSSNTTSRTRGYCW